jgi:hypothetical protein
MPLRRRRTIWNFGQNGKDVPMGDSMAVQEQHAVDEHRNQREQHDQPAHPVTLAWALRRAVIGLLILMVGVLAMAVLLHNSIEPTLATTSNASSLLDQLTALAGRL